MDKDRGISRREFLRFGVLFGGALASSGGVLTACGGSQSTSKGKPGSGVRKVDIAISHWPVIFHHLPWMVAMDQKIFADHGIEIGDVLTDVGGGQTLRNMSLGDLPFADGSAPSVVTAFNSGIPLQIVGTAELWRDSLMALPDTDVESVMDLGGKKLGYTSEGSVTQLAEHAMLGEAGILEEVELVAVGGTDQMLPALRRGLVDVAISPPNILELVRQGAVKEVIEIREVLPHYVDTSLITSIPTIRESSSLISEIVKVKLEANEWILNNHDAAVKIYSEYANVDMQVANDQAKMREPLDTYFDVGIPLEWLQQLQAGMYYAGMLDDPEGGGPQPIRWREIIDQSLLPEEKRIDIPETMPLPRDG
jgi:NitT/TauT family transport system substrate-binding protein